jgi:hypothetical protein
MHGLPLAVAIILFAAFGSSAAEGQMDEKTLCPAAIRAFDGKDSAQTQEFLRFVQNVFDELDAQSSERGEPALKTKLIDMSVEGSIILGFCRQRPTETIYEATADAYRGLKLLRKHTTDTPIEKQHRPTEDTSRFR